jgi:crossover junction endodeoxyribonuclease RuvC
VTIHAAGIDFSLSNTGVAVWREGWDQPTVTNVEHPSVPLDASLTTRMRRAQSQAVRVIRAATAHLEDGDLALFAVERMLPHAPTFKNAKGKDQQMGGRGRLDTAGALTLVLNGLMRHGLITDISIGTIKMFATGNGAAKKPDVIRACRLQFPNLAIGDDNAADAVAIVHMCARHLAIDSAVRNPRPHVVALEKVEWPLPERN